MNQILELAEKAEQAHQMAADDLLALQRALQKETPLAAHLLYAKFLEAQKLAVEISGILAVLKKEKS